MADHSFTRKRSVVVAGCLTVAILAAFFISRKKPAVHGTPIGGKYQGSGMTKELVAFTTGGYLHQVAAYHYMAPDKQAEEERAIRLVRGGIELLELDGSVFQLPRPAAADSTENMAHYAGYLIAPKYPGRELGTQIHDKHGKKVAAFYELSIKPWVGALLYVENLPSETSKAAADSVEAAGKDAELPPEVYMDVVSALRDSKVTHSEATRRIAAMQDRVETMLKAGIKK